MEDRARALPWAHERRWTVATHVGQSNGLPAIDLHDLSVRLALELVEGLCEHPPPAGGALLITGRGRHTGGRSRLRDAVLDALGERAARGDLALAEAGPGRVELVFDAERVRAHRPGLGLLFWLVVLLALAGLLASWLPR